MPAKGIDKCCNKATDSRENIDFKICQIPPKQCHAAKNTDNKKTKQKTAMQISPQDHDCGQQKPSRSFQAFFVEYYAKQHSRDVWRSGEINIWVRRKSGVKQTRGKNG